MLTSHLLRVAVIVAGIAVCVYARGAIHIFLNKLFQTCIVCLILFLIYKRIRRRRQEQREKITLLTEQENFPVTNDSDFVQKEDCKRSTEGASSSDKNRCDENSSDYYEDIIKYETKTQEEPRTKTKGEYTIQEESKTKKKEEDTVQGELETKKKVEGAIQEGYYRCEGDPHDNFDVLKFESKNQLKDKTYTKIKDTKQDEAKGEETETVISERDQKHTKVMIEDECKAESFLKHLHLQHYYPCKLKLMDVMALRECTKPIDISTLAINVAMKLIMINYTARDDLDNLLGCDDDFRSINPLDLLLAIFKCSSPMLQQVLADKLFKCKLAIPFLHPPFDKEPALLTLWPFRSIIIECKTEKGSLECNSVDCPCHVVTIIRLGRPSVSKSKLMNEIISDQYHNTFFNKDCSLGSSNRVVSEGLVEVGWYLSTKKSPYFNNVTMFFNLRGDGKEFSSNSLNLSMISNVVVVLLHIDELFEDRSQDSIKSILSSQAKICLAVDAGMYQRREIKKKIELYFQQFAIFSSQPKLIIVAMHGEMRRISTVKTELRNTISDLANESTLKDLNLSERVKQYDGNVDERTEVYKKAENAASEIMGYIISHETNVKKKVVPLQGKPWQTWSEKMKWSNKASLYKTLQEQCKLQCEMLGERRKQAEMCNNLSPAMSLFLKYLQEFISCDNECHVFILFLKQMLDERYRNILPGYLSNFQKCWQDLKSARDTNEYSHGINDLREKLYKSEECLAEASFGFVHLCKEMGQIYESLETFPPQNEQLKKLSHFLPGLTVQLLLMGLPFEIMDVDVANVPLVWVNAVLNRLKETIGDKRLLTLSVLGIQSSGKSTLLNTMFGLQFPVSAGRCTRGVYMQLVPVTKEKSLFDYLLVIDTEGLRAPELAHQMHNHDNELAAFVIGLGDITIMNIKGENTAEMKDVLQTAVHAFLRLKLANERLHLTPSCIFIHQNVPSFDAHDKMMQSRQKFVDELDMMTKEAADQENIAEIQSFNQVIKFDRQTNVWYFPDLWKGDPPMAPANPGYSDKVSEVKESIVIGTCKTRSTYLTITDTISRITDLWNGIVKDDFLF